MALLRYVRLRVDCRPHNKAAVTLGHRYNGDAQYSYKKVVIVQLLPPIAAIDATYRGDRRRGHRSHVATVADISSDGPNVWLKNLV